MTTPTKPSCWQSCFPCCYDQTHVVHDKTPPNTPIVPPLKFPITTKQVDVKAKTIFTSISFSDLPHTDSPRPEMKTQPLPISGKRYSTELVSLTTMLYSNRIDEKRG